MMFYFLIYHNYLLTCINSLETTSCILIAKLLNFNIISHLPRHSLIKNLFTCYDSKYVYDVCTCL